MTGPLNDPESGTTAIEPTPAATRPFAPVSVHPERSETRTAALSYRSHTKSRARA